MKKCDLVLTLGQRLILFLCLFLVGYIITLVLSYVLGRILTGNLPAMLRISALAQDVIAFVVPAVATAVFVSRRPAELLCVAGVPTLIPVAVVALITVVSVPAQEAIIYWNYNISLPESMSEFASMARKMEDAANSTLRMLISDGSVASVILNILVVGVAAAFAEELLFRGCFQRLLTTGGINPHVAIWVVAFFFSALHFQFFGFVPRMLLGAYFGYLLYWTGNIWVPIIAHFMNNAFYVLAASMQARQGMLSTEPSLWNGWTTAASVVLTAGCLVVLYRSLRIEMKKDC